MKLDEVIRDIFEPAFKLLPPRLDTVEARLELLAIGRQESRFIYRRQEGGPARGFWQFEQGGGVRGVLMHPSTTSLITEVCQARQVQCNAPAVYRAIENDDVLACCMARLLLWTDSHALPALDDADGAWSYYLECWRPGKPHRKTWNQFHNEARAALGV